MRSQNNEMLDRTTQAPHGNPDMLMRSSAQSDSLHASDGRVTRTRRWSRRRPARSCSSPATEASFRTSSELLRRRSRMPEPAALPCSGAAGLAQVRFLRAPSNDVDPRPARGRSACRDRSRRRHCSSLSHPMANSGSSSSGVRGGGSDRDEALQVGGEALLAREFPYYRSTHLGNPISQMPGSLHRGSAVCSRGTRGAAERRLAAGVLAGRQATCRKPIDRLADRAHTVWGVSGHGARLSHWLAIS